MKKRTWPELIKKVHEIEDRHKSVIYASDDELAELHEISAKSGHGFALTPTELYYLKQIIYDGMSMRSVSKTIGHERRWILSRIEAIKQLDYHIEEDYDSD